MGVKQYISSLEEAVIQTVTGFGVPAHRSQHTGVWVWDAEGREKKICAIGESNCAAGTLTYTIPYSHICACVSGGMLYITMHMRLCQ